MVGSGPTIGGIQYCIRSADYRFTLHVLGRIIQRRISVRDIEESLLSPEAEIIENYPDDPRSPSCLVLGFMPNGMPLHVQCTYPPSVLIITAYAPSPDGWSDWRVRT